VEASRLMGESCALPQSLSLVTQKSQRFFSWVIDREHCLFLPWLG
jgi:hypothetical protein